MTCPDLPIASVINSNSSVPFYMMISSAPMVMAIPGPLMRIFTDDIAVIEMGEGAMRILFALYATVGIQMVTGAVFQATGNAKAAFVLSLSRQVIFLIPLLALLPFMLELTGIWLAFPTADLLSFLLAILFVKRYVYIFYPANICNQAVREL